MCSNDNKTIKTYLRQRLKPQIMALHPLDPLLPRKPPIPVHHERDMLRDGTLLQRPDKELAEMLQTPFDGR